MRPALVLFAREPAPGRVKTRLAAGIGAERAARLYGAFLDDLSAALLRPERWRAVLAHAEASPGSGLMARFGPPWELWPQGDGDLVDRVVRNLLRAVSEGAQEVVAAGSDAPTLVAEVVERAFASLSAGAAIVTCPSPDGGFALVGVRRGVDVSSLLSSLRWSSRHALSDLLSSASERGLDARTLEEIPDVDVEEDLARLGQLLSRSPGVALRTASTLASLGLS